MRLKSILIIVLLVLSVVIGSSANSFACSTFMLKKDTAFILGHNLDERQDIPGYVFINKRGIRKTNFNPWDYLWSIKTPRIQWVSKYGSITFNANARDYPDGGINEAGLYIWEMSLIETKYPDDNSKPHLSVDQWIQYQLDNYQSVSEVIQNVSEVIPFSNAWHFFIADKQGNSATIEFIEGKSVVHTNQSMPITVLCNSQYDLEMLTLSQYTGFGGWKDPFLQYGYDDARFVQAASMIRDYDPGKTKPVVEYGFDILKQMERGNNRWQVVIDVPNSTVYFNTRLLRKIKYFSYKNFDFSTNSPVQVFDLYSNLTGDITKRFVNYSVIRNTTLRFKMMDTVLKIYPLNFSPTIRIVLAVLILIFISPFVVWLFRFIKRSVSKKSARVRESALPELSRQNRFQSWAARVTAALNGIFNLMLLYFFVKYNYYFLRDGLSICGSIVLFALIAIVLFTMGEIILLINLWKNKAWPLWERLNYLLLILTAVFMLLLVTISFHGAKW